jgi:endo-1,4-beta-xylanase
VSLYAREFVVLTEPPEDYLIHQAYRYKELFHIFKKYSDVITNVTFWGFNDSHTNRRISPEPRMDWPLPFDDNLKAKYAYWALVDPERLPPDIEIKQEDQPPKVYKAPYGTPVMDGEIDEIWQKAPIVNTDTFVMSEQGATAAVRLLWDETHLYVLADVNDTLLSDSSNLVHERDSFEVFLDENNGKTPAFEKDDYQYRVNFNNKPSWGGGAKLDYFRSVTVITDTGYLIELEIDFQNVTGKAGMQMGLDLQVNDDFGDGKRSSISKWNDPTNESWRNTSGWGVLGLVE